VTSLRIASRRKKIAQLEGLVAANPAAGN